VNSLWHWLSKGMWRSQAQALLQNWNAGRALIQQQKWPEALDALDRALALVGYDPSLQAELHFHRGYALEHLQRLEEAISSYAACQVAEADKMAPEYCHIAAFRQAYLLIQLERWPEAEVSLRTSVQEARRMQAPGLQLNAMRVLLGVYQTTRRFTEALECAHEMELLALALRDESTQAMALDVEGDLYLALGQSSEALRHYERSLDLFRKLGNVEAGFVVKQDIVKLYRTSGQWEKATGWLGVCLREEESVGNLRGQARIAYDLACLHIHRGELPQAGGYLQRSMGLFRQAEDMAGADLVGRTLMGLSILMHRAATANWLTFGDIERGSAKLKKEEE
jgi:tetratricopeptide (TPR) repeat protein